LRLDGADRDRIDGSRLQDAVLIVCLPTGSSLARWAMGGTLWRECGVAATLGRAYRGVIFVSDGGASDAGAAAAALGDRVHVVPAAGDLARSRRWDELAHRLLHEARAVFGSTTGNAVIKADAMRGCAFAARAHAALQSAGWSSALVARGGRRWSRLLARESGPNSTAARAAGEAERALCEAADIVVAHSASTLEDLAWRYSLPASRTIPVPEFVPEGELIEGEQRCGETIVSAGPLAERSGFDLLIRGISAMSQGRRDRMRLVILGMGTGPERGAERLGLRTLAGELGVQVEIHRGLAHADVLGALNACAVYAQASAHEGDPRVVLEAMGGGAACVVADSPGLGELIDHAVTGLRAPRDPGAFAQMIEGLLDDRAWGAAMGLAGARRVRAESGLESVVRREQAAHLAAIEHAERERRAA